MAQEMGARLGKRALLLGKMQAHKVIGALFENLEQSFAVRSLASTEHSPYLDQS
jgi:hypothetical protein